MVGQEGTVLSSSKVLLRPFRQDDYSSYFQIASDPEVAQYQIGTSSKEGIKNSFHDVITADGTSRITWAIVENEVMKFAGFIGIDQVGEGVGEITISLSPSY